MILCSEIQGNFAVELYWNQAPRTCRNFIELVSSMNNGKPKWWLVYINISIRIIVMTDLPQTGYWLNIIAFLLVTWSSPREDITTTVNFIELFAWAWPENDNDLFTHWVLKYHNYSCNNTGLYDPNWWSYSYRSWRCLHLWVSNISYLLHLSIDTNLQYNLHPCMNMY